jgi:AcrR family transcriptional regulator
MSETLDRRQQKTRAALQAAFRDLLLDQGYETLRIGDVAARANVGRSTFYEHYRTMDDLLRASLRTPFMILAGLVEAPLAPDAMHALGALLQHFRDKQQMVRVLLGWPTRPVLASALADLIASRLRAMPHLAPPGQPVIPVELIGRQIAEMHLALLDSWIAGRPALDMQAVMDALQRGTHAVAKALLASE